MVKVVAHLFAFLILAQSVGTYFGTLEEFGVLLEHAKVHSQEYGDNFIVFLSKHYGDLSDEHSHDESDKENQHDDLPFTQSASSQSPITINESFITISAVRIETLRERNSIFSYEDLYTSPYTSGIFQPPKQA